MAKTRFIGGCHHGKFENIPECREGDLRPRFRAMKLDYQPCSMVDGYGDPRAYTRYPHTEEYELRPLGFGPWARVHVMAKVGMTESEFMRRVADLVEGV